MTISYGSELLVTATASSIAGSAWMRVAGLTGSLAIATFADRDGDAVVDIKAQLLDVSGTTVTLDASSKTDVQTSFLTGTGAIGALVRLSNTVALYVYRIRTVASPVTSEIRATVMTVSGSTITQAETVLQTDVTTSYFLDWELIPISSTQVIWVIHTFDSSVSTIERFNARVLTVSGSGGSATVTEGTLSSDIYESPSTITTSPGFTTCPLSSTKGIVQYVEGNDPSGDGFNSCWARVLTASGSGGSATVTLGTEFEISAYDANSGIDPDDLVLCYLTSSRAISYTVGGTSGDEGWQILTISGSTITADNTNLGTLYSAPFGLGWTTDYALFYDGDAVASDEFHEFTSVDGSVMPSASDSIGWTSTRRPNYMSELVGATNPAAITRHSTTTGATGLLYVAIVTTDVTPAPPATDEAWDVAAMRKPCSIDADDTYIYIAALDSGGTPVLIQFATALDADGSLVFDPGTGTDIGVECSATDPDTIWIAGEFGGTDTVEQSTNGAASFAVVDPGTFAPVTAFDVGPDTDERVIVAAETSGSIGLVNLFETVDDGANWIEKNAGLSTPASVYAIGRFPTSPEEIVLGNANNTTDRSDYSPNAGGDLDDITSGTPTYDATGVIVG